MSRCIDGCLVCHVRTFFFFSSTCFSHFTGVYALETDVGMQDRCTTCIDTYSTWYTKPSHTIYDHDTVCSTLHSVHQNLVKAEREPWLR